jgi:hypothetical protein
MGYRQGASVSGDFVVLEGGSDLVDVGAVDAHGFTELVAGDVELFGPVADVGGHFGVDDFGVVGG